MYFFEGERNSLCRKGKTEGKTKDCLRRVTSFPQLCALASCLCLVCRMFLIRNTCVGKQIACKMVQYGERVQSIATWSLGQGQPERGISQGGELA